MKQLQQIQQWLKVPKNNRNDFGKYNYRKTEDILAAVKPILGGCTITLSDEIVMIPCEEDRVVKIETADRRKEDRIIHVGGRYFLKATAAITDGSDTVTATGWAELDSHAGMSREQCAGAASSYARKYALCGLFGIDDSSIDPDAIDNRQLHQQTTPQQEISAATTIQQLVKLWNTHQAWQTDEVIMQAFTERKQQLTK